MGKDYYKILGVDKSADEDAIKKAYKKMVCTILSSILTKLTLFNRL